MFYLRGIAMIAASACLLRICLRFACTAAHTINADSTAVSYARACRLLISPAACCRAQHSYQEHCLAGICRDPDMAIMLAHAFRLFNNIAQKLLQ